MKQSTLIKIISRYLSNWHPSRLKTFESLIRGIIATRSVQSSKMKLALGEGSCKTREQKISRLLKEQKIDWKATANIILDITNARTEKKKLIIDRTNWKYGSTNHNLLVLAINVKNKFTTPLLWQALDKRGNSNTDERIELMQTALEVCDFSHINGLIADREFVGDEWIDWLYIRNIRFYIRMKENMYVIKGNEKVKIADLFIELGIGQRQKAAITLNGKHLYIAATVSDTGELVAVLSNHGLSYEILDIYARRWGIETMFKNLKSNGFNLEDTHLKDSSRLEKLFAAVAIASAVCCQHGLIEEEKQPTKYKKSVGTYLFSTFKRGFQALSSRIISIAKNIYISISSKVFSSLIFHKSEG